APVALILTAGLTRLALTTGTLTGTPALGLTFALGPGVVRLGGGVVGGLPLTHRVRRVDGRLLLLLLLLEEGEPGLDVADHLVDVVGHLGGTVRGGRGQA